jgi:[acyl-carrier-protein] S-malonyltransferase
MTSGFVFPGQGSQAVGMLSTLAETAPQVRQCFDEASQALGLDLWDLTQEGPEEELNRTENTQPAMLAAGVAVWRVWQDRGGAQPVVMAGHSLGEYTALVCAGALDFAEAVGLVADRGRYMQEAVPQGQGGMAALIGLDDEAVRALCTQAAEGEVLSAVNYNSPGQVVIAGARTAVERAVNQSKAAGAKRAVMLPVSVPSHCALMHPAAERMRSRLQEVTIRPPKIPVIQNENARDEKDAEAIREALVQQIESPVRWVETIERMAALGVQMLVECGPGKVLTGLNKRIDRQLTATAVYDETGLSEALAAAGQQE